MLKEKMKTITGSLISLFYKIGLEIHLFSPKIILAMDGGICSQMHQYLLGEIFRQKGYSVEFNLVFFKTNSKDVDGLQVRNFDLLLMFPDLNFKSASRLKSFLYSRCFNYVGRYPDSNDLDWINVKPPRYMSGYYADPSKLYTELYAKTFKINKGVLDAKNRKIYDSIEIESVAVHVRRGDLSSYNQAYGHPVTITYFIESMKYFCAYVSSPVFYFFSDDTEYVEKNIIPSLPFYISYVIVENAADRGYMDLILISKCSHQITSKGSLGKYGALLNMKKNKVIVMSKDDPQTFMFDEVDCLKVFL